MSKRMELDWFFHWSEQDKIALKAEPWDEDDSFAFWISEHRGPSSSWEAGYGETDLGAHDRLVDAIAACERHAHKIAPKSYTERR